jgi:hypothetical protein
VNRLPGFVPGGELITRRMLTYAALVLWVTADC